MLLLLLNHVVLGIMEDKCTSNKHSR